MDKVTVPIKVAEVIEECRKKGMSDWLIIEMSYTAKGEVDKPFDTIREWAFEEGVGSPDMLLRAVMLGYRTEGINA